MSISPQIHSIREATLTVSASDSRENYADYRCDGTADEVAIQAAIDALPATGGTVTLLEGNYTLADEINPVSNLTLIISGGAIIKFVNGATPTDHIDAQVDTYHWLIYGTGLSNVVILNYGILNANDANVANWPEGISLHSCTNCYIHAGRYEDCHGGVSIFDCTFCTIEHAYSDDCLTAVVWCEGCEHCYFNNIYQKDGFEVLDFNGYSEHCIATNIFGENVSEQVLDINASPNNIFRDIHSFGTSVESIFVYGAAGIR